MLLSELATVTTGIALYVLDKTTGGALEEVGVQILRLLKAKFQGKPIIEKAKEDPKLLEAAIITEASRDSNFRNNLETLVVKFQKIQNTSAKVIQNTASGVNINSERNQGTVIGQQQYFRN